MIIGIQKALGTMRYYCTAMQVFFQKPMDLITTRYHLLYISVCPMKSCRAERTENPENNFLKETQSYLERQTITTATTKE